MISNPNGYHSSTNNSGNTTVSPQSENHTERLTFTGSAGTRNILLDTSSPPNFGDRIVVACVFPATPGILVNFYTTAISGTPLADFTTDGSQLSGQFEFVYNSSGAFEYMRAQVPA
jgi:hypothetical protein